IGHVIVNSGLDRPWSQYFCCIVAANREFVRLHPVATKRALRAFLKATHFCSTEPERAARIVADRGYRFDMSMGFIANYVVEIDSDTPIKLLAGVHAGCFELFGTERVNAIRDLKGKTVAVPALGSAHHNFVASMAAHVGLDAKREINFVTHPVGE